MGGHGSAPADRANRHPDAAVQEAPAPDRAPGLRLYPQVDRRHRWSGPNQVRAARFVWSRIQSGNSVVVPALL